MAPEDAAMGPAVEPADAEPWREPRWWQSPLYSALRGGVRWGPLLLGAALLLWATSSQQRSRELWRGQGQATWPPPGTFLPGNRTETPGSLVPGASSPQSRSRLVALASPQALFQTELGTPTTSLVPLQDLDQVLALTPGECLLASAEVSVLATWSGGLMAGIMTFPGEGLLDVWPDLNAAPFQLNTTGEVTALQELPGGGILAATFGLLNNSWNIWPTASSVWNLDAPVQVTFGPYVVKSQALLLLPSGSLIVGTALPPNPQPGLVGAVMMWDDVALLWTGQPSMTLPIPQGVQCLLALPDGGLAAGPQGDGPISVWWNASVLRQQRVTSLLTAQGGAMSLIALSGGGLAAVVDYSVAVWPDAMAVMSGGQPQLLVPAPSVESLLMLPGSGIVAAEANGAVLGVEVWRDRDALKRGEPPAVLLSMESVPGSDVGSGFVSALLALPGNGLAVAYGAESASFTTGTVCLWPELGPLVQNVQGNRVRLPCFPQTILSLSLGGLAVSASGGGAIALWKDQTEVLNGSPSLQLEVSGCARTLLELPTGGLAAGTWRNGCSSPSAGPVEIWLNASQGGSPSMYLNASGAVTALVLLSSGTLAAGTEANASHSGTVDLWQSFTSSRPQIRLDPGVSNASVVTLLALPGGGLAASLQDLNMKSFLCSWPNASFLYEKAQPPISLSLAPSQYQILSLTWSPTSGIVVCTNFFDSTTYAGLLLVWSTAQSTGEQVLRQVQIPHSCQGLVTLPGGGLVVLSEGTLLVWPDSATWSNSELPLYQVPPSMGVTNAYLLAPLPKGGFMVGNQYTVTLDLWPGSSSNLPAPAGIVSAAARVSEGLALGVAGEAGASVEVWTSEGNSSFSLEASLLCSSVPLSMVELSNGYLAVGTLNGTVDVFAGRERRSFQTQSDEGVQAMALLPRGGLAAGGEGAVELWHNLSAALEGLPADTVVQVAAPVRALLWVEDGLLIGTDQGLLLWKSFGVEVLEEAPAPVAVLAHLPGDGLAVGTDDYQVRLWRTEASALRREPADMTVSTPALMSTVAILDDGSLAAGGAVFTPRKCPAGAFSPSGSLYQCQNCPGGWLSEPGAANCPWPNPSYTGTCFAAVVLCLLVSLFVVRASAHFRGHPWLAFWKKAAACAGLAMSLGVFATFAFPTGAFGTFTSPTVPELSLLAILWLSGLLQLCDLGHESQQVTIGLLVLATAVTLQQVFTPAQQPVWTGLGQLHGSQSLVQRALLVLSLCLLALGAVLPDTNTESRVQARPLPEDSPAAVWHKERREVFELQTLRRPPARTWGPCRLLHSMVSRLRPFVQVGRTFAGEHGLVLLLSLFTLGQMSWQLSQKNPHDASVGLITLTILVATLQVAVSLSAILLAGNCFPASIAGVALQVADHHFRMAIVLKYVAFGLKLAALVLPFQQTEKVYLWWQCETPALCPDHCSNELQGGCSTTTAGSCVCLANEILKNWLLVNCFPVPVLSCGLTALSLDIYCRSRKYRTALRFLPAHSLLAHAVLAVVPALLQLLFLYLIIKAPKCLVPSDVAVIVYPAMLASLLANEVKRALRGWHPEYRNLFSTLYTDRPVQALRPLASLLAMLAAAAAAARAKSVGSTWPSAAVDCSSTVVPFGIGSVLLVFLGVAAALLVPVAAPRPEPEGSLLAG